MTDETSRQHVTERLLRVAITQLGAWQKLVPAQGSRHIWSVLPVKYRGAQPGQTISYQETDDQAFMDRFLKYRPRDDLPYFDPFSHEWLTAGYWHSNLATFRKNTFIRSWGAATWQDGDLTLAETYVDTFKTKGLTKAGITNRIPALPCAVWFFKRPSVEWPHAPELHAGIPVNPGDAIEEFRVRFNFTSEEFADLFDLSTGVIPEFPDAEEDPNGTD